MNGIYRFSVKGTRVSNAKKLGEEGSRLSLA
jgi:hypothetical protein